MHVDSHSETSGKQRREALESIQQSAVSIQPKADVLAASKSI
jgi:hypothetical protein